MVSIEIMGQWFVKAFVVLVYVGPAIWFLWLALTLSFRVVKSDYVTLSWLNPLVISERYVSQELEDKVPVPDAIYQDDMIVARVRGDPEIDNKGERVVLPELIRAENLETDRPFFFRHWKLELISPPPGIAFYEAAGGITMSDKGSQLPEHRGRVLTLAHCRIVAE